VQFLEVPIKEGLTMTTNTNAQPRIVSRHQWLVERKKHLAHKKELTNQLDQLRAGRRRLPMVKIEKDEAVAPVEYNYRNKAELEQKGETYFTQGEAHGLSIFLHDGDKFSTPTKRPESTLFAQKPDENSKLYLK
jgi:predicted dithiol-disulfide oxidoreductase (DUF899 family)